MAVLLPPPEQLNEFHVDLETLGMAHPIYYEAKQLKLLKITGENGVNVSVVLFDDDKKGNLFTVFINVDKHIISVISYHCFLNIIDCLFH